MRGSAAVIDERADRLTILRTKGGLPATKTIGGGPDGRPAIVAGYGNAKRFSVRQVWSTASLASSRRCRRALGRVRRPRRARTLDRLARHRPALARRPGDGRGGDLPRGAAALASVRCRPLARAPWPRPAGRGVGGRDRSRHAAARVPPRGLLVAADQRRRDQAGRELRLGFWLDRPVGQAFLDRWLAGAPVDASVFRPVQPIYVAPPILKGVADPVPVRTGLLRGRDDTVAVPDLPPVAPKIARPTHSPDGRRYVSGGSRGPAARRLAGLCRAVERAQPGSRHHCLVWAAARAVELDDAMTRAEIAAALLAAARTAGPRRCRRGAPAADQERLQDRRLRHWASA